MLWSLDAETRGIDSSFQRFLWCEKDGAQKCWKRRPLMKILFVHQNFPGQFKFLAPALAAAGHEVLAMSMQSTTDGHWNGIKVVTSKAQRSSTAGIHPWIADFETKTIRGEASFRTALSLRASGYTPDIIIAHPGWGESLFLKEVWPSARLGVYCEFFYNSHGADVGFDPEFPPSDVDATPCSLRFKNLNNYMHFDIADAAISPTHWQASTFPQPFRDKITVVHDGIDTDFLRPDENVSLTLNQTIRLTRESEVITFVNRNLEPYRGYHVFMRSLPELLKQRPNARVLIVGGDDVSYGARPSSGGTWKEIFASEVRSEISDADWSRVHFLGNLPYNVFVPLLQLSTVHVYLTYPFVLSWSLLEAMSVGCAIVASDTAPVREAIMHNETGRLVNFFDHRALVAEICGLLSSRRDRDRLGAAARAFAIEEYDLKTRCLPRQLAWCALLSDQGR